MTNSGASLSPQQFAQTHAMESGRDPRGFGLWVCQELASHYRGGFELDAQHQGGTKLMFWLPNREKREELV